MFVFPPSSALSQTQNCPTMYKDMLYKANKWTVDETMSMRGRDLDAVFSSMQMHKP